jgi:hypothetical protein
MAAPTSYTEKSLAEFMHAELGRVANVLTYNVGASDPGDYAEAVNESLLIYGAETIDAAADIAKLRAIAREQAWKKAVGDLTTFFKFSADGGSYERQQMFEQAKAKMESASLAAMVYSAEYSVRITRSTPVNDPYRYMDLDDQTL